MWAGSHYSLVNLWIDAIGVQELRELQHVA